MSTDLHIHTDASDGVLSPGETVRRAAGVDLNTIAITDHDTVGGCGQALEAGRAVGIRVIPGCEFSVAAPWGEMHLLAYFLPPDHERLEEFLVEQRSMRSERASNIVRRLDQLGIEVDLDDVTRRTKGDVIGRPHVARALVECGAAVDINDAFRKYLATNRPAFVPKALPELERVTQLVRDLGGVTSAAHLGARASKTTLARLEDAGVDAVEVIHPGHVDVVARKIGSVADQLGLLKTGGSDWHGEDSSELAGAMLGGAEVPDGWVMPIEKLHLDRRTSTTTC